MAKLKDILITGENNHSKLFWFGVGAVISAVATSAVWLSIVI
jgi:hypothetical protein